MKKIDFMLKDGLDTNEFKKIISFVSQDIENFEFSDHKVELFLKDEADVQKITASIELLMKKYVNVSEGDILFKQTDSERTYVTEFVKSGMDGNIHYFDDGMIGLNGIAIFLFDYFDGLFKNLALKYGAYEKKYPVLLPLAGYKKTGYLKNSPQYAMFCGCAFENIEILQELDQKVQGKQLLEILEEPKYALSPSACFHTYIEYENRELEEPSTFTFLQSVFRNEGRFNYHELGRLRDYHVREIVFVGSPDYVSKQREILLQETIRLLEALNLVSDVTIASDPFIVPRMQKFKTIQKIDKSKYELHLYYGPDEKMSVASFNLHGTAFTYNFHMNVKACNDTVTGCIGYGIERWVLSFLCQYGIEPSKWPEMIRDEYYNDKSRIQ